MMRLHPTIARRLLRVLAFIPGFLMLALCARANAQATLIITGAPQLFVQRGQTTDVTLHGQHLASVTSVAMVHARGLQVAPVEAAKGAKPAPGEVRLHIACDADAAPGEREIRLLSPTGVSSPLRIIVGQYPEVLEKEPNNTPDQAQDVVFPASLAGKIGTPGDIDCFRFNAAKGQTLVFDVHAARSRSPLDAVLSVFNEAGRELPSKADQYGGDPTVVFTVPADGRYVVSVRDLQYRGGEEYSYHIDAGIIPYIQSVLPMSAQPGKVTEVKPLGVNLTGAETIPLDLTYAGEGDISVRARASGGTSNAVKVAVNDLTVFVDDKPGHSAKDAVAVPMPVDISGRIDQGGDENYFKFHVARKQLVTIDAITRQLGSPVVALLTLRNAQGGAMQTADSSVGDGTITRDLEAGDYLVSIRDLFFNGGPRFAYRLQIRTGGSNAAGAQDFLIRYLPDALRVSRGSNTIVYADLQRKGGFTGDVTVMLDDLPPGVKCPPLVMNDTLPGASGILVLSAGADAPLGSFPIRLRASGMIGSSLVVREGTALLEGRDVEQAYLTVLDTAPVTIESVPSLGKQRLQQLATEIDTLSAKLAQPSPQLQTAQAEWEKKVSAPVAWTALKAAEITAASGTQFTIRDDGSILASGPSPERDTYTFIAPTALAGITAIRLEALPDPKLPKQGPGRAITGNFVLSNFVVTVADKVNPTPSKPVPLRDPVADFEQSGMTIASALTPKPGKGWGISPNVGVPVEAVFFTTAPVGGARESVLTCTLDHQFGQQHTLGCFRLSVTTDRQASVKASVPPRILKLLAIPAAKRTKDQNAQVASYYKTIDPQFAEEASRLEALRTLAGARTEMVRLEAALAADSPEIKTARVEWEKSVEAGSVWLPLDLTAARSKAGVTLTKQADGSWLAGGANPATDTYTLVANSPIKDITAVRIECLTDPSLPVHGPGRAVDGNFMLTRFAVTSKLKDTPSTNPATKPATTATAKTTAEWKLARATTEQKGHAISSLLDGKKDGGWGIAPSAGRPAGATFFAKEPFATEAGSVLTIVLDQQSSLPGHTLGRFRIWVTSNPQPEIATTLPPNILSIVKTSPEKRAAAQKTEMNEYFRSTSAALDPVRQRVDELAAESDSELTVARGKKVAIPFLLNRAKYKGDVSVTLKGFTSERDPQTGTATSKQPQLKVEPLEIPAGKGAGRLNVEVERQASKGPRYVVLRVDVKDGDDKRIEYSLPFVLTVLEK